MRKFGLIMAIVGAMCGIALVMINYAEENSDYKIWCVVTLWASTCASLEYRLLKNKL
jgi:hypothetical protein